MITPEEEKKVRQIIQEELQVLFGVDRYTFQKHIQILNGRNIQTGRSIGTKIGTAADQKIGFFGATPVVPQSTDIKTSLVNLGLLSATAVASFDYIAASASTASTSFVDASAELTITLASAQRVLLLLNCKIANDTLAAYTSLTFKVDGTDKGTADGLIFYRQEVAGYWEPAPLFYITDSLAAGTHTIKVRTRVTAGTLTLSDGILAVIK